ncbi:MAG TPA: DNA/RNA helicase domain-containing protein, partial [Methylomirabilota bacterium]|nr:DNA/RNA helicase domain-containing protein [Methylomirabilota bacterium]
MVVELKQWGETAPSNADRCVETFVGGKLRPVPHPSVQVGQYEEWLLDNHTVFYEDGVGLAGVAWLHNLQYDPAEELFAPKHAEYLERNPLFTGDQSAALAAFLNERLDAGTGHDVMVKVLESRYKPSKKLLDHTAQMVAGQQEFILLDEQLVVFESVLAAARDGFHRSQKAVLLVKGGPGTGKSVVALHLVGRLAQDGYNAQHATGSKAFTENMRRIVGSRARAQFAYFNQFGGAAPNDIDVLVLDEAHRIRETSAHRFMKAADRTNLAQVDELIRAAKTSVFFIDDLQLVRPDEVGSSALIRDAANRLGAQITEFQLDTQFRCAGSDAFVSWVDHTLGLDVTANELWDGSEGFDFQIVDSVEQLDAMIRSRADEGYTARLSAGFCWPWSNPLDDGTLVPDVQVGGWQMPWNAKGDAGRLATGIPKERFWASDPNGINQV